jgi:hypothetical protein
MMQQISQRGFAYLNEKCGGRFSGPPQGRHPSGGSNSGTVGENNAFPYGK